MDNASPLRARPPGEEDHHAASARTAGLSSSLERTNRNSEDDSEDNEEVARALKISPSQMPTSEPPASPGIRFWKMDWPKPGAPTSPSSSWPSLPNAAAFRVSFDPATPPRRTVSSAIQKSLKPPAILSASASTPMRAKRLKKSFAVTSTVALKTPPFASFRRTGKKSSLGAAAGPTRFSEATL